MLAFHLVSNLIFFKNTILPSVQGQQMKKNFAANSVALVVILFNLQCPSQIHDVSFSFKSVSSDYSVLAKILKNI